MSIPKIPADSFIITVGTSGFSLLIQETEIDPKMRADAKEIPCVITTEVRLSPLVAKQLMHALAQTICGYEDQFGEIKGPPVPAPGRAS